MEPVRARLHGLDDLHVPGAAAEIAGQGFADLALARIGIAPEQIPHLFEKFTVADDSSTSKYGGTGLGLALSQKLCGLMGGDIFVVSELGKGSRFTVRMPVPALKLDVVPSVPLAPQADAAGHFPQRMSVTADV